MPCGCGGAGQWQGPNDGDLVPADQIQNPTTHPSYFWTGEPSQGQVEPVEVPAAKWTPSGGTEE